MPLERETVARAALAVLDEVGLDGLTVRRIAEALGVQNPALYWHFKNKQDLLDRMAEVMLADAYAELGAPPPNASWPETLSALAHLFHRALSSHRDGARVIASANLSGSETVGVFDDALRRLQDAGFSALAALNATLTISAYTMGSVLDAQLDPYRAVDPRPEASGVLHGGVDAERYPALAGALGEVARVSTGQDRTAAFEAGLQIILAGIGATLPVSER
ncbi:MAG TPA: TetR/AcrR family transcriptional regulator C-terminal domain-containing protein [Ktedonobacterales bacterium]|jgi:TetR/AcrR family transcriptional regulator, tetracycline repressor protein|nr:TetR/AcrR family transcriptional regulator C-terminal domain-containing protein [Ktedonobacterales bacterium]